jgi:hypothetical protein
MTISNSSSFRQSLFIFYLREPIGHKDFYPNGGRHQNGCKSMIGKRSANIRPMEMALQNRSGDPRIFGVHFSPIQSISCSHSRSIYYYAESINSKCSFRSVPCKSFGKYTSIRAFIKLGLSSIFVSNLCVIFMFSLNVFLFINDKFFQDDFRSGKCKCGWLFYPACAYMGHYSTKTSQYGVFYLHTNKTLPYCLD